MLDYGMADTNKPEDTDAVPLMLAMRQACKNNLFSKVLPMTYKKTQQSFSLRCVFWMDKETISLCF